jgi:long-subunit fatty acid transport protein
VGGRSIKSRVIGICAAILVAVMGTSQNVWAGGYDTPMIYTARHIGMGGAAVSYVNDPSAMFHNPAGLGHIKKLSLMGDFTFMLAGIQASPDSVSISEDSEPVIAPFFLLGGAYRVTDFLVVGLSVFPVASAAATYKYKGGSNEDVENTTTLVFIESSLGAAVNIDSIRLKLGASYRITYVSLNRQVTNDGVDSLAFDMTGWNFLGFRVGAQWEAIPNHLSIGINYRHQTVTEVTQDEFTIPALLGGTATDGKAEFTLPGRIVFGVRGDYANFGLAVDLEYAFNSQNSDTTIQGTTSIREVKLANVFKWENAITLRVGAEYRINLGKSSVLPRLGFIYDAQTSVKKYPTAFGTPPAATYVFTLGAGYEFGGYRINVAYAYRFGSTTIEKSDLFNTGAGDQGCSFCSLQGDYSLFANAFLVDFSYDFK